VQFRKRPLHQQCSRCHSALAVMSPALTHLQVTCEPEVLQLVHVHCLVVEHHSCEMATFQATSSLYTDKSSAKAFNNIYNCQHSAIIARTNNNSITWSQLRVHKMTCCLAVYCYKKIFKNVTLLSYCYYLHVHKGRKM